jgi:hypothetical protein
LISARETTRFQAVADPLAETEMGFDFMVDGPTTKANESLNSYRARFTSKKYTERDSGTGRMVLIVSHSNNLNTLFKFGPKFGYMHSYFR